MSSVSRSALYPVCHFFVLAVAVASAPAAQPLAGEPSKPPPETPAGRTDGGAAVEVRFVDDSTLKVTLRDERLEVQTAYGKLLIPVGDIQQIEFGLRVPAEAARRIEAALTDLGASEYRRREAAAAELVAQRERAYPQLLKAAKSSDPEVARRAEEVLARVREAVPAERLEANPHDVIQTADSKFTGRVMAMTLRVATFQFGEQQMKLADLRSLRSLTAGPAVAAAGGEALTDPGTLWTMQGQIGKSVSIKLTGAPAGAVWGTDVYTLDSALAAAAVHAGVLRAGQTGVVRVMILGPQAFFQGSVRNGVTSHPYGGFPAAFRFVR